MAPEVAPPLIAPLAAGLAAGLLLTAPGPAAADSPGAPKRTGTVSVSDARFQVLSPTLIRTEYAGDGRFEDRSTFNAIGRGSFTPPPTPRRSATASSPSPPAR